ncbi:MAG: hypothetical protein JWM11_288, partial [Planctomycetaceae bacterium]|nr:hypothetical protein [Planctomycetaceae bacterium]
MEFKRDDHISSERIRNSRAPVRQRTFSDTIALIDANRVPSERLKIHPRQTSFYLFATTNEMFSTRIAAIERLNLAHAEFILFAPPRMSHSQHRSPRSNVSFSTVCGIIDSCLET